MVLIMDVDYQNETLFHVQGYNDVEEQIYFYIPKENIHIEINQNINLTFSQPLTLHL